MPPRKLPKQRSNVKSKWPKYLLIGIVSLTVSIFVGIMIYRLVKSSSSPKKSDSKDTDVVQADGSSGKKRVLFIYMVGCGYCNKLKEFYDPLRDTEEKKYEMAEYRDVPELMELLKISGFPAVAFFVDGELVDHVVGYSEELKKKIVDF